MITIDEFKRAYSRTDVDELFNADNLSESEQLVLFEELKARSLAKINLLGLSDGEIKPVLAELIMIELRKRYASVAEYQALVDTERMLIATLEKQRALKKDLPSQSVHAEPYQPLNTNLRDYI